mgnify:CR=1 FL=1
MKRFISVFAIFLSFVIAFASEKTFTLVEGDLNPIKGGGNIFVTFDFEDATYDNKEPLAVHYENLSELIVKVLSDFNQTLQKKAKKINVVDKVTEAEYTVTVKVNNMDCYFKVMSFVPGSDTKMWGFVTIKDNVTGENIAVIKITECDGGRDFSVDDSFVKCFHKVGEELGKAMNKGKL